MSDLPVRPQLLAELARRYGTPLYVYSLPAVREAIAALRTAVPERARLYYSVKANPHPLLVGAAAEAGLHAEISSPGELAAVLRAGIPAGRILYTGPGKTASELAGAVRAGVRLVSVESPRDRQRLDEVSVAAGVEIDVLVRLGAAGTGSAAGLRMTGTPSQFGVAPDALDRHPELLRPTAGSRPVGFHLFSASNVEDGAALAAEATGNVRVAADAARRAGFAPRLLALGGGFPAPFAVPGRCSPHPLRAELAPVLDSCFPGWRDHGPRVAFESGRAVAGPAGVLVTAVQDVKAGGGRRYVVLDAGVNVLGGMSGLGRLLAPAAQPVALTGTGGAPARVALVGPLCTPLDVHNRAALIALPDPGDLLAVPNTGAYGLTASLLGFLGREIAAEVVVDGDTVIAARRLELTEKELVT